MAGAGRVGKAGRQSIYKASSLGSLPVGAVTLTHHDPRHTLSSSRNWLVESLDLSPYRLWRGPNTTGTGQTWVYSYTDIGGHEASYRGGLGDTCVPYIYGSTVQDGSVPIYMDNKVTTEIGYGGRKVE